MGARADDDRAEIDQGRQTVMNDVPPLAAGPSPTGDLHEGAQRGTANPVPSWPEAVELPPEGKDVMEAQETIRVAAGSMIRGRHEADQRSDQIRRTGRTRGDSCRAHPASRADRTEQDLVRH